MAKFRVEILTKVFIDGAESLINEIHDERHGEPLSCAEASKLGTIRSDLRSVLRALSDYKEMLSLEKAVDRIALHGCVCADTNLVFQEVCRKARF